MCWRLWSARSPPVWIAPSLETLLVARAVQGLGAAAPRVIGTAMVRDMYKGREMARIVSFVMMAPAMAPLMGQGILLFGTWRTIFAALVAFGLLVNAWVVWRQPETLAPASRRPLQVGLLCGKPRKSYRSTGLL